MFFLGSVSLTSTSEFFDFDTLSSVVYDSTDSEEAYDRRHQTYRTKLSSLGPQEHLVKHKVPKLVLSIEVFEPALDICEIEVDLGVELVAGDQSRGVCE